MNLDLPKGGALIIGLGVDVTDVARIHEICERHGERFLARVFTDEERAYCAGMAQPFKHLAARFAAKEAVSKCFATGIGAELGWKSVSVYHGAKGQPLVRLDEKGQALLRDAGATGIILSISHTGLVATAVAVLVRA
jgi:holo-[acyl-carrier protein] synthase